MNDASHFDVEPKAERLVRQTSYDFERQCQLRKWQTVLQNIAGKNIVSARVNNRHIELVTGEGYRFAFDGLIEAISPGEESLYD